MGSSSLIVNKQEGSSPTIGIPADAYGKYVSTNCFAFTLAEPTFPTDKWVLPQQISLFLLLFGIGANGV